jgi:excisionase family DNA binding protein
VRELKKDGLLKTDAIAKYLGVSSRTVTEWATLWVETGGRDGLPGFKIGKRQWRFRPEEIEAWLLRQDSVAGVAISAPSGKIGKIG